MNLGLTQDRVWVKTESGCEYWTSHTDAKKITWDGDCKDGKVDGEGELVLFKNNEVFYVYNGTILNGYTKKGELKWTNGNYANYIWLWDNDPAINKFIGIDIFDEITYIGELGGFEQSHLVKIFSDGTFKAGIVVDNEWKELKTVEEIENYFINNYDKSDYEHFIPIQIPKKTIAISYFDNTSGDKSYDPLIKGMADMLISDLSNIESIKMVEREKLDALLKEIDLGESKFINNETAQKMGKGLGAQYILTGSFIVMGDAFRIDARLINVENSEIVFSKSVNGSRETFFDIEKDLAKEIISKLELSISNKTLSEMEEYGTRSYDAYYYWTIGNGFLQETQNDSAIKYYEKSLEFDPRFKTSFEYKFLAFKQLISLRFPEIMNEGGYLRGSMEENYQLIEFFKYCKNLYNKQILSDEYLESLQVILLFLYPRISNGYYQLNNDTLKALETALDGKRIFPDNYTIAYGYGYINYLIKDYNKALNAFDRALELSSDDIPSLTNLSVIMQDLGNWERVMEINKKRLDLEPNNYQVLRNLAFAYYNLGEHTNAIEYFIKMSKIGGGEAEAFSNIGTCYFHMSHYTEAIDYLEKAIVKIESYGPEGSHGTSKDLIEQRLLPTIYEYLAISYERIRGYDKAIDVTKKHIDIVENSIDLSPLYLELAYCYQELSKINEANQYYEKAIELDPNNWNAYNNYAYFYQKQGDLKTAEDMFKTNIQRAPNIPNVYHSMGEFYQKAGEYDEAIDHFDSSIERDSTYAISYYNLGQIYEEIDNELFFEYYLKAAELNNNDAQRWVKKNKKLIDEHENKSTKAPATDYIEELKKLAELRDLGIITDEEFDAKKKELLGL